MTLRVERLAFFSAKIRDHLLDPDQPSGWSKAKFFLGRGFDRGRAPRRSPKPWRRKR